MTDVDLALYWNDVVNDLNARDHTGAPAPLDNGGPTRTSRAGALAHLALHDAYFGVAGGQASYMTGLPAAPAGAAAYAAASAAYYTILRAIYPSHGAFIEEKFAGSFNQPFANSTNQDNISAGVIHGRAVAMKLLERRGPGAGNADDGYADERHPFRGHYVASAGFGRHRVDPHNPAQGYLSPYWGSMRMFATQTLVALAAPPGLTPTSLNRNDPTYLAHHDEVRVLGGRGFANSTIRTPTETVIGIYWAYDGAQKLGTPPRLYNRVVQAATQQFNLTEAENIRLFALVNAAMADAGIHAWYWKYRHDLWRPVIGIREIDDNFGASGVPGVKLPGQCDPGWLPLGAPNTNAIGRTNFTPGFPAYPSGHASFGAAAFHVMRLYLKSIRPQIQLQALNAGGDDNIEFSYVSEELDGIAMDADGSVRTRHDRKFTSAKQAIVENAVSRVYLGVHWRFDGTLGGYKINNLATARFDPGATLDLGPVSGPLIGGVPLGLNIAENIFSSGLKESTQHF